MPLKEASFSLAVKSVFYSYSRFSKEEEGGGGGREHVFTRTARMWNLCGGEERAKSTQVRYQHRVSFILYFTFTREKKAKQLESRPACIIQTHITSVKSVHGGNQEPKQTSHEAQILTKPPNFPSRISLLTD